jgi:hypothetical protein
MKLCEIATPVAFDVDALQEKYSYGHCMYLALAMHDLLGWEIEAVINEDDPNRPYVAHAWVNEPGTSRDLDIYGFGGAQDFFSDGPRRTFSRGQFIRYVNETSSAPATGLFPRHDELEEAARVVRDYMTPTFKLSK